MTDRRRPDFCPVRVSKIIIIIIYKKEFRCVQGRKKEADGAVGDDSKGGARPFAAEHVGEKRMPALGVWDGG